MLLLDTSVWAHLVSSAGPRRSQVQARLRELHDKYPGATRATSAICVAEALAGARRLSDPAVATLTEAAYRREFAMGSVVVVPADESVLDQAASLRSQVLRATEARKRAAAIPVDGGKLLLPDAIVAASCFAFNSICRSRSCFGSTVLGEFVIKSTPLAVFGKAITSRMLEVPHKIAMRRSKPSAMPPCGGAPYLKASSM